MNINNNDSELLLKNGFETALHEAGDVFYDKNERYRVERNSNGLWNLTSSHKSLFHTPINIDLTDIESVISVMRGDIKKVAMEWCYFDSTAVKLSSLIDAGSPYSFINAGQCDVGEKQMEYTDKIANLNIAYGMSEIRSAMVAKRSSEFVVPIRACPLDMEFRLQAGIGIYISNDPDVIYISKSILTYINKSHYLSGFSNATEDEIADLNMLCDLRSHESDDSGYMKVDISMTNVVKDIKIEHERFFPPYTPDNDLEIGL